MSTSWLSFKWMRATLLLQLRPLRLLAASSVTILHCQSICRLVALSFSLPYVLVSTNCPTIRQSTFSAVFITAKALGFVMRPHSRSCACFMFACKSKHNLLLQRDGIVSRRPFPICRMLRVFQISPSSVYPFQAYAMMCKYVFVSVRVHVSVRERVRESVSRSRAGAVSCVGDCHSSRPLGYCALVQGCHVDVQDQHSKV